MNGGQTRERGKIKSKGNEGEGWAGKVGGIPDEWMNLTTHTCSALLIQSIVWFDTHCPTHAPCHIPVARRARCCLVNRSIPAVIIATRFRRRFRSHAQCRMERNADENARDMRIITGRDSENRNDVITILMKKIGGGSRFVSKAQLCFPPLREEIESTNRRDQRDREILYRRVHIFGACKSIEIIHESTSSLQVSEYTIYYKNQGET